jgi:hypothetical protein
MNTTSNSVVGDSTPLDFSLGVPRAGKRYDTHGAPSAPEAATGQREAADADKGEPPVDANWLAEFEREVNRAIEEGWRDDIPF